MFEDIDGGGVEVIEWVEFVVLFKICVIKILFFVIGGIGKRFVLSYLIKSYYCSKKGYW